MEDTILNDVLRVLIGLFIERKQTLLVNRYIVQTVRSKKRMSVRYKLTVMSCFTLRVVVKIK